MRNLILIISLLTFGLIVSCSHKSNPTEPQETADLTLNMLLKPAKENGYNVTRVHVKITRNTFEDSLDLTINGESASGTFTDLIKKINCCTNKKFIFHFEKITSDILISGYNVWS